ncbi:MAG: ABC transporter permease [Candidatus Omnitrophota bacterium]|nr:ABC transporter permease [Candidatus Omnitrophota bacterium]
MKELFDFQALRMIWLREMIRTSRDRTQIAGSLARPILWLVVLGLGLGSAFPGFGRLPYTAFLFPGIIAMNLLYGSFLSAISIIWDREFGFLKEMLVAPISRSSIVLGKSASGATVACFQGSLVFLFLPLVGVSVPFWRLFLALPVMFLIAFPLTALGLWLASRMTSFEGFGTLANFVVMPMFFMSGAVFPLQSAPPALQWIGKVNPMTYGVDLLRGVFYGAHAHPALLSFSILFLFSAVATAGAVSAFSRRS